MPAFCVKNKNKHKHKLTPKPRLAHVLELVVLMATPDSEFIWLDVTDFLQTTPLAPTHRQTALSQIDIPEVA